MSVVAPEIREIHIYPFDCPLCGLAIQSADDRTLWHGLGNCGDICSMCGGSGIIVIPTGSYRNQTKPKQEQCPVCAGLGVEKEML